jgi:hypothetical protein
LVVIQRFGGEVLQSVSLWRLILKEISNIDATYQLVLKVLLDFIVYLGVIINTLFGGVWLMILRGKLIH